MSPPGIVRLAGAENFARFGEKRIELLRRFLPFKDGTPSQDQLCDIFAMIDATHFQRCFVAWVAKMLSVSANVVAIDGKTSRRTADKRRGKAALHMVCDAFAARQRLVLGQVKVEDKSNEIIAIPALVEMLEIEGAIVTIDAMGCQGDIARRSSTRRPITSSPSKAIRAHCARMSRCSREQKASAFRDAEIFQHQTTDVDHGRIETRIYTVIHDVDWLQDDHEWPGLKSVIMVESEREIPATAKDPAKIERETRFYIISLVWLAHQDRAGYPGPLDDRERPSLLMDMMFRDDECRVRTNRAPANCTTIKHLALNLIRRKASGKKDSLWVRGKVTIWDDGYLASLVVA